MKENNGRDAHAIGELHHGNDVRCKDHEGLAAQVSSLEFSKESQLKRIEEMNVMVTN